MKKVLVSSFGLLLASGAVANAGTPPSPQPSPNGQPQVIVVQPDGEDSTTNNNRVSGRSKSESRSESRNETSNSQTNIQIVPSTNVYEFGRGISAPVTSINASAYGDTNFDGYGSFGGVVTVVVPLGGATGGRHGRLQEAIVAGEQLAFASSYATTCANIAAAGFTVNRVDALPDGANLLAYCGQFLTKGQTSLPPAQPAPAVPVQPAQPKVEVPSVIRGLW